MADSPAASPARGSTSTVGFLDGGGIMGAHIRQFDWTRTLLGPPDTWPGSLRTALRILLTANHPVFIFWGPELTCFYNDAYSRSLGPEQHPSILGKPGRAVWRDIWDVIGPQIDLVLRGEGSTWNENALVPITRHGRREEVYWTYSYAPIHDDTSPSGVGGVLVLTTETTAHVVAEARQRMDATRWRTIFEQSPAFMCVVRGPEHRFEYANPRYRELIARDHISVGARVADVLPEVVAQGFIDLLDRVYTTGQPHTDHGARVMLAGKERFVDFVFQPICDDDGTVTGILAQGSDVTQRALAQTRLREFAARLELATNAADIGIHEYDIVHNVLTWDDRVRRLWDVAADEPVSFERFLSGLVEEDRAPTLAAIDRSMVAANGGTYRAEYRVRARAGEVRWVRATGQVEFAEGVPQRMVGTVQDITREKLDEAALIEADRQKDVFLATLAHELRNPLAPIRSAAEILAMPGVGATEVRWVHDVIARQASHMASLLDDLLDVARLTQGRMVLKREAIDLRAMIDAAMETVHPALHAKAHRVHVTVPHGRLIVSGDAIRLCQVFTNLLSNAIKYMDAGGAIDISADVVSGRGVVRIRDQGDGMSPELLQEAFGMFRQASISTGRANAGLGIGLALVRAIVNLHGGQVHAHSDGPGSGSTFTVELPLTDPVGWDAPLATGAAPTVTTAPRRILIADDNLDAAESLAMLLSLQGHDVQTASDGAAALSMTEAFQPHVIVVDIGMPVLNGYEVARELRRSESSRQVRLIALTGWGKEDDRERALAAGFDAHLTKPPDLLRLLDEIAQD